MPGTVCGAISDSDINDPTGMEPWLQLRPVLPSLNVVRDAAWYTEHFGAEPQFYEDGHFALLRIGRDCLHVWQTDNPALPQASAIWIVIADAKTEFDRLEPRGIIHPNGRLRHRPYGVLEFSVLDPSGNLITFGQILV